MMMKIIRLISRFITGAVLIFSGFVKAIDPLGSAYKFSDYFSAFKLDFLDGISLPLGIFLSAFELVLGLVIILGYQKKGTYWVLMVFLSFFTLLTFVLAIFNPVTDCGCFGDALIMTNWQTFFKNVGLMIFVLILFSSRKRASNTLKSNHEKVLILLFFAGTILLSSYSLRHLPLIDFRPYDVGTYIRGEMVAPADAPQDVYNTTLIYRNIETGEKSEFKLENYPKDTLKWEFVTSESKLVSKGYEPPIHDFGLTDKDGFDYTDELLDLKGYSLMMISYDLKSAEKHVLAAMNEWNVLQKMSSDFNFVPVTASGSSFVDEISEELGLDYSFYTADEIMQKTIVRSNPGFVLLKNGVILSKWAFRDFPEISAWNGNWREMIEQFESEQDPEIQMMIDEGYMEEIEWNIIEFDQAANQLLSSVKKRSLESNRKMIAIGSLLLILILLQLPSLNSINKRG